MGFGVLWGFPRLTLAHLCGLERVRADGSVVIENGKEEDDVDVVVVAMDDSCIEEALEEEVLVLPVPVHEGGTHE